MIKIFRVRFIVAFLTASFSVLLLSCSSASKSVESTEKVDEDLIAKSTIIQKTITGKKKQRALELFIQGKTNEMKELYERAILDYQDALEFDPYASGIYYSLAKCYLNLNRIPQALRNSKLAIKYGSGNVENYILTAQIYDYAFLRDSAIAYYEMAIKLDSTKEEIYYLLASRIQKNKPLKAIEIYETILRKFGPSWSVLSQLAELYEQVGMFDKALQTIAKLSEFDPDNVMLKAFYADILARSKRYDDALKIVDELIKSYPDNLEYIEIKARVLFNKGSYYESSLWYEKIILSSRFTLEDKIKILSSFYLISQEKNEVANFALRLAIKLDSLNQNWQTKALVGEFYLLTKNNEQALKYFEQALQKGANDPSTWFRVSNLLLERQEYDLAIKNLSQALSFFPDNYALNYLLGAAYSQKNEYKKAIVYFRKAANIYSEEYYVFTSLGFCYYQLNVKDSAAYFLEIALSKDPENVETLGMLALIYNSLKIFNKSDSLYLKALSLDPDNPLLNNNYAYSLSERGLKLEEAMERIDKALKADPENSSYLDTKGWIYYKMKKFEQAKEYIKRSLEKDPDNAVILDHLGDVYYMLNDIEKAREYWKKSYEIDSTKTNAKIKYEKGQLCDD